MISYYWLVIIGIIVGTMGTLIGAGGGFILVPVLLLLYPKEKPEFITSLSLVVVFFNALSGSISYSFMKRIDYKSGLLFSIATIPGAILGSITVSYIPRSLFNFIFGSLMICASIYLFTNKNKTQTDISSEKKFLTIRHIVDKEGHEYNFSFNKTTGFIISLFVGYFSSLLGIGGGIIHVPMMVNVLNYPVHIATATSHFILSIMALSGTITNILSNKFPHWHGIHRIIYLSLGVFVGAQIGAKLSKKIKGQGIIRGLAIGLGIAGIRILFLTFQ